MFTRLMAGVLFTLGILVVSVYGQPPGGPGQPSTKAKETPSPKAVGAGDAKKADPADALVQAALANDPDVKLAQAKMQLAEAEMAKAKQAVVLKVLTLNATVHELKNQVTKWAKEVEADEQLVKAGALDLKTLEDARFQLEHARAALAKPEMELKLLTGESHRELVITKPYKEVDVLRYEAAFHALGSMAEGRIEKQNATGPIADRIRAALDKKVKLGNSGEQIGVVKAQEIFKKEADLDVPFHFQHPLTASSVKLDGQELTVGAWIQFFEDNNSIVFYVREYGLLVTSKELAPPNALTVLELWKQPLKKDAHEQKKAEPFVRKYPVPAGTAEILAKMLQNQNARLQVVPVPGTNEILVLANEADQGAAARMLKEISNEKEM